MPAHRALVVLPTRDLASQVYRVFARMCPAAGLTVGLMAGKANEVCNSSAISAPHAQVMWVLVQCSHPAKSRYRQRKACLRAPKVFSQEHTTIV